MKKLDNNITYIIIAAILAISYFGAELVKIAYRANIQHQANIEQEFQRQRFDDCTKYVRNNYYDLWDENCKSAGLKNDCRLDIAIANSINKDYKDGQKMCLDRYKNKAFTHNKSENF